MSDFSVRLLIEPRDVWIGVYVKPPFWDGPRQRQRVYILPLPMIGIIVEWTRDHA